MVDNSSPALQRHSTMDQNFWPYVKPKQMDFAQKCTTGSEGSREESPATSFPARKTHAHTHKCAHTARAGRVVLMPLKGSGEGSQGRIRASPAPRQQELVRSHRGRSTGLSCRRFKCDSWPSLQTPCVISGISICLTFPICVPGRGTALHSEGHHGMRSPGTSISPSSAQPGGMLLEESKIIYIF